MIHQFFYIKRKSKRLSMTRNMKLKEIELSLTCKFNALNKIWKESGLQKDFYRRARLLRDIYHHNGRIVRYGNMYKVEFISEGV